jgi:hypothetical protein
MFGRMLSHQIENPPEIANARSVQAQYRNGDSPYGRQWDDLIIFIVPCKMVVPIHFSRMKQRYRESCQFVGGLSPGVFVIVASLACQRKVGRIVATKQNTRSNVFDRMRLGRKRFRAPAILAAPTSPLPNQVLDGLTNGSH